MHYLLEYLYRFHYTIGGKAVLSLRKEQEVDKTMASLNRTGYIWSNATNGANRRHGPGGNFAIIDTLPAGTPLLVLCYSHGDRETFTAPNGVMYTSDAWDFVITSDQDPGGYVADVLVDTGSDITKQLGNQGTCAALAHRLTSP
jgi:hypothetical protein